MAKYRITAPDGGTYEINAPDTASADEVMSYAKQQFSGNGAGKFATMGKNAVPDVSKTESALRGIGQGLTFNFGDEIAGGVQGAYRTLKDGGSLGDNYAKAVEEQRARNKAASEANPGTFVASEFGGALLPLAGSYVASALTGGAAAPTAAATTARVATLGGRMAQGAKAGAPIGAAYGMGAADPDAQSTWGEAAAKRAVGAGVGGALGYGIGGASVPVLDAAGAVVRGFGTSIRARSNPPAVADEKIAQAFSRDRGSEAVIAQDASKSAPGYGVDPALMADPNAIVADLGGKNVQGLMRAGINRPNAARQGFNEALNERQTGQWKRIEDKIASTFGDPRNFYKTSEELIASRKEAATPAYEAAYNAPFEPSNVLLGLLKTPQFEKLHNKLKHDYELERALSVSRSQSERLPPSATGEEVQQRLVESLRPLEFVHRMKMEIDGQINLIQRRLKGPNPLNTDPTELRQLMLMKDRLREGIAKSGGEAPKLYMEANQKFAGDKALENALERGFDEFWKMSPDQIRASLGKMTVGEAEMYKQGAARALADRNAQGSKMNDRVKKNWDSPDIERRIEALTTNERVRGPVKPKGAEDLWQTVRNEGKMYETRRAAQGNSTTAQQISEQMDTIAPGTFVKTAADIIRNPWSGAMDALGRKLDAGLGMTPSVAEALLRRLQEPVTAGSVGRPTSVIDAAISRNDARSEQIMALARALSRGGLATSQ